MSHEIEKRNKAIKKIASIFKKITEFSKNKNIRNTGKIAHFMGMMHSVRAEAESDCQKGVPQNEAYLTAIFTCILECTPLAPVSDFEKESADFILAQADLIQNSIPNVEVPQTERLTKVAGRFFAKAAIHTLTNPLPSEDALSLEPSLFLDFLKATIEDLKKQNKTKPIEILFVDHVTSLKNEYQWSPEVVNCYGFLLSCYAAPHLTYDETGIHFDTATSETNITYPISELSQEQKNKMHDIIQSVYDETMDRVTTYAPGIYLAEQLETDSARQIVMHSSELTEAVLGQHLAIISDKMASTAPAMNNEPQNKTTTFFNPGGLKSNLNEIVSLSNDGAMLASILNEPRLSQHLSMVSSSIERTIVGFQKLEQGISFLSNIASAASLFTGAIGIIAGIAGLCTSLAQQKNIDQMTHLSDQMVNLGKQTEHLGKQLDCVLRNQLAMTDLLLFSCQSVQNIGNQLTRLAHITHHNFEFLKTKDLSEAVSNVKRYLKNESAVPLTPEDLRLALITLQSWLVDPEHLCSIHMNGGLYADKPLPPKETVEILSSFNDLSSINMVGFILKLLQQKEIFIPEQFFKLPSLELYTNTVKSFYLGMGELKPTGGDGCRAISKQLQNTYALFSEFVDFLSNDNNLWQRLLSLYVNYLPETYSQIRINYASAAPSLTVSAYLSEQPDNNAGKINLLNVVNHLEEIRLLLYFLSKWTNRLSSFIEKLPSKNDFLVLKGNEVYKFSKRVFDINSQVSNIYLDTKKLVVSKLHNPFAKLDSALMTFFFNEKLYEPLVLHFASGIGESYVCPFLIEKFTLFPPSCNAAMMAAATSERQAEYKNGADATDFMVIISACVGGIKYLRHAYQYYVACFNNNQSEAAKLRAAVFPGTLLLLVAILGRYDIFQSISISDSFDFKVTFRAQAVGSYTPEYISIDKYYYTTVLNRCTNDQRLVCRGDYMAPVIPLMIAAKLNHVEVIQGLLSVYCMQQKDIELQKRNSAGQTAAEIAFNHGHHRLAKLLDDHSHTLPEEAKKQLVLESHDDGETCQHIANTLKYGTALAQNLVTTHRGATTPHLFSPPPSAPAHVEPASNGLLV